MTRRSSLNRAAEEMRDDLLKYDIYVNCEDRFIDCGRVKIPIAPYTAKAEIKRILRHIIREIKFQKEAVREVERMYEQPELFP